MVGLFFLIRCNFNNVYTSTQSFLEFRNGQLYTLYFVRSLNVLFDNEKVNVMEPV